MTGIDYVFTALPEADGKLKVADGVYWLRFPLPFALDHINLWLIEEGDGWVLIDTGFGSRTTRETWTRMFDTALEGRPLKRILVTHYHPDHLGQAAWLSDCFEAPVTMTAEEWRLSNYLFALSDEEANQGSRAMVLSHGLDHARALEMTGRGNVFRAAIGSLPEAVSFIAAGDVVTINGRPWEVFTGGGHSPEHACLFRREDNVLLSGDQVLPAISSNVSVRRESPDSDPLNDYLTSLRELARLPAETLVLPAHGKPFRGVGPRAHDLIAHHEEQLQHVEEACQATPRSAADLLPVLFRRELNAHQLHFAMGESIAHANHLYAAGRVQRHFEDEVYRFATV